jgi:hypothetical protein
MLHPGRHREPVGRHAEEGLRAGDGIEGKPGVVDGQAARRIVVLPELVLGALGPGPGEGVLEKRESQVRPSGDPVAEDRQPVDGRL